MGPISSNIRGLAGKKLLITGSNGFLGVHTGIMAHKAGATPAGIDLPGSFRREEMMRSSLGGAKIDASEADLSSLEGWAKFIADERPDAIVHLAGTVGSASSAREWSRHIKGNFLTLSSMFESVGALPEAERPVVVFPGSQMEYGAAPMPWTEETPCRPVGPYAASKLLSTELLLAAERSGVCRACAARFPIIYGPGQPPSMFIPELISDAFAGRPFRMTEGRQRRRFTYVADAAHFLLAITAKLLEGRSLPALINAPSVGPKSMREVAEMLIDIMGSSTPVEIGAVPMRRHEVLESWPDDSLAASLGFSSDFALDEGLEQTVEWYRGNRWFREEPAP